MYHRLPHPECLFVKNSATWAPILSLTLRPQCPTKTKPTNHIPLTVLQHARSIWELNPNLVILARSGSTQSKEDGKTAIAESSIFISDRNRPDTAPPTPLPQSPQRQWGNHYLLSKFLFLFWPWQFFINGPTKAQKFKCQQRIST